MIFDIIGAGIGGLTTAIALEQKGIKTRVYEQSKELIPVGAGIILANNAMQVYEKLGLRKEIESNGNVISSANITNAQLQPLSCIDFKFFEERYKVQSIAIHRGVLQQILLDRFGTKHLFLDHKLKKIEKKDSEYQLTFTNESTIISNGILGADGENSKVRSCLFSENTIRNANQVCWRGVCALTLPAKYQEELNEAWGKGTRFGFVQISLNKVYWFGVKSFENNPEDFPLDRIEEYFKDFHPIVRALIKSTTMKDIHTAVLSDLLPMKKWFNNHVCLIGDAAHATTPNMGQGACQAIEDAYILSECLSKYQMHEAFAKFQNLRFEKVNHVVKTSWTIGKVAHWENPLAIGLRNRIMKIIPASINQKQSEKVFQLEIA